MAEDGGPAAGEDRGDPTRLAGENCAADDVGANVDAAKPTRTEAHLDLPLRQAKLEKLPRGNHAVLSSGEGAKAAFQTL